MNREMQGTAVRAEDEEPTARNSESALLHRACMCNAFGGPTFRASDDIKLAILRPGKGES